MKKLALILIILLIATSAYAVKYRVETDVSFDNKVDAVALMNYIEKAKTSAVSVAPNATTDLTLDMPKKCIMHECRHDEIPPMPCSNFQNIDFSTTTQVVWK